MTEPGSEGSLVRYYCTAGKGMEPFLTAELKEKLAAKEVCQIAGKVLFSSSAGIHTVRELKAAERLFLLFKQDSPVQLSAHTSPAKAAALLQSRLLGDRKQWTGAAVTWSRLQGELADRRTTINTPRTALGGTRRREEGGGSGEETAQRAEGSRETCGAEVWTLETKRKRDDEDLESGGDRKAEKQRRSEGERERQDGEERRRTTTEFTGRKETDVYDRGSVCVHAGRDDSVDTSCRKTDDATLGTVENAKPPGGRDKTLLQPESSSAPLSFRISCKCTGSVSRCLSAQEVSRLVGVGVSRLLGWKADLKNPQLEVNVYLSDDVWLLGFPLTRTPLASRSYMKSTGLRSTVGWAMASLAPMQPGSCVLDPMCGVGTILIEAAQEHTDVRFLGMDIDDGQLQKANENVAFAELSDRIQLLKASSTMLPLLSATVDAVVCDLPFGRKFGTKTNMAATLPLILAEMERVLCVGGVLVLLLSPQLSCLLKDTLPASTQEAKTQTGIQDSSSPSLSSTKQQARPQEADPQSWLQHTLPPPLCSLKHQATLRVSLGAIDGLIHKYVKI